MTEIRRTPSRADQLQFVGMIAAHESVVAELYRAFAEAVPQYADFFTRLAAEEVAHARMIASFSERVKAGAATISPGRFDRLTILDSLNEINGKLTDDRKATIASAADALAIAADIEQALVEAAYLEVVESDAPELKRLLAKLVDDSRRHLNDVRNAWDEERARG